MLCLEFIQWHFCYGIEIKNSDQYILILFTAVNLVIINAFLQDD